MQERGGVFYGWWIVGATFTVLFIGLCSGFYTVSVFLEPIEQTFGWNRTRISLGFTIAALLVGLLSPVVGIAVARFGVKAVQLFGALVSGCGLVLASFIQVLWQYYTIYIIMAIGLASVSLVPSQTLISHWFEKRRGTAMGIIMTGIGLGGMAMVFIASMMNEAYGWRWAYRFLGFLVLAIVVPVILFFIRNRPEDMGLVPDGIPASETGATAALKTASLTVKEAFRTLPFHLICLVMALFSVILGGLTMHAIALFRSYGVVEANTLWSLTLGASVAGRIIFGYLSDKLSKKILIGVSWLLHILGFWSITMASGASSMIWGFVICYGLALGSFVTLLPLFVAERFGVEHFSKLIGLIGLFQVIGLAIGSVLLGRIYDATSSYAQGVSLLLGISVISFIITVLIAKPKQQSAAPAAGS